MTTEPTLLAVPAWLTDISAGDEISLPGGGEHLVVRGTGWEMTHGESGAPRRRAHLACERLDGGGQVPYAGELLERVTRYIPLEQIKHRASWNEPFDPEELAELLPALVDEVVRLRASDHSHQERLDESRRERRRVEEIMGGRRRGGDT